MNEKNIQVTAGNSRYLIRKKIDLVTRHFAVLASLVVVVGCGTTGHDNLHVTLDPEIFRSEQKSIKSRPFVEVTDIRRDAVLQRTALETPLGEISLKPNEIELIRSLVHEKARIVFFESNSDSVPEKILCGLRTFNITTPSTPLYWDVTTEIELIIRIEDEDHLVSAKAVERTYVWPSTELIKRVTESALTELGGKVERTLRDFST